MNRILYLVPGTCRIYFLQRCLWIHFKLLIQNQLVFFPCCIYHNHVIMKEEFHEAWHVSSIALLGVKMCQALNNMN